MFNVGGPELLVILLVALIVLGPQRLPDAARQVGKAMGELRRLSSGFQQEMRSALDDATEAEARKRGDAAFRPVDPDAPAVAPVDPARSDNGNGQRPRPRRTTPLRAPRE